jgi:hypothetical protein
MKRAKQQLRAPRNPLVAVVLFKKYGAHGKTIKALRREDKVTTKRKLDQSED